MTYKYNEVARKPDTELVSEAMFLSAMLGPKLETAEPITPIEHADYSRRLDHILQVLLARAYGRH